MVSCASTESLLRSSESPQFFFLFMSASTCPSRRSEDLHDVVRLTDRHNWHIQPVSVPQTQQTFKSVHQCLLKVRHSRRTPRTCLQLQPCNRFHLEVESYVLCSRYDQLRLRLPISPAGSNHNLNMKTSQTTNFSIQSVLIMTRL